MGDIARILSFDSFEAKPIDITIEHSINQRKVLLEKRIMEYLANRCGFYEIFTYPWIDENILMQQVFQLMMQLDLQHLRHLNLQI